MKYEITNLTREVIDPITKSIHVLHRIRALEDFKVNNDLEVVKGQLGGLIETESNLSQDNTCWVGLGAMVFGDAEVTDDAFVYGEECLIYDHATVSGQAVVYKSHISGWAIVDRKAKVFEKCLVSGNACVTDEARLDFGTYVMGNAIIMSSAHCTNSALIEGWAHVSGCAFVQGGHITEHAAVTGHANVRNAFVSGNAQVSGNAFIDSCWVMNRCQVSCSAVMALGFKATEGVFLHDVHYGRGGFDAFLLKLATAFKGHEKIYRFIMGKVRGLSRHYLVVPSTPASRSAAPSKG